MPNFESSIGGRKFASQGMRDFEVPDETEQYNSNFSRNSNNSNQLKDSLEFEREVAAVREVRRTGKEKINEGAKRRIEVLLGMVQTTREVVVGENNFVLRSLKSKEMRDSLMATSEYDGTIQAPYEIRRQILSRSLISIAGVSIEQFLGSDSLETKMLFLDEMDESLLVRLYDEYIILSKDSKEKFAVKTEEDVKEVVDNIKK